MVDAECPTLLMPFRFMILYSSLKSIASERIQFYQTWKTSSGFKQIIYEKVFCLTMWIRIFLRIRLSLKLVCLCRTTGQFFPFGRCPFFIWKFLKITYIIYKRSSIFYGCEIFKYLQEIPHNIHSVKCANINLQNIWFWFLN